MSATVQVVVNGETLDVPTGLNVTKLLLHLGIVTGRIAIERNIDILPRAEWDRTEVSAATGTRLFTWWAGVRQSPRARFAHQSGNRWPSLVRFVSR